MRGEEFRASSVLNVPANQTKCRTGRGPITRHRPFDTNAFVVVAKSKTTDITSDMDIKRVESLSRAVRERSKDPGRTLFVAFIKVAWSLFKRDEMWPLVTRTMVRRAQQVSHAEL